jgi:hypothetical protein
VRPEAKGAVEAQPAQLGQQVVPVVPLDFSAGRPTEEDESKRARVCDGRSQVQQVLSRPPGAHARAERIGLFEKGAREHERRSEVKEAPAEDGEEAPEGDR